jgi:alpha-beta hydrolase superfamily lysophospholipase
MFPGYKVTGEGLDIRPSDNIEMLRALGRDPLVIKKTRIDTVYGLTNLMQAAFDNSASLRIPVLLLYGEHDEIISPVPICRMLEKTATFSTTGWRLLLYPDGYHMLTRDLQADVVLQDIATWTRNTAAVVPSGLEVDWDAQRLRKLCSRYISG